MNEFPLYPQWLDLNAQFNAANVFVATAALFVVTLLIIFSVRYPKLMTAARVLLPYGFAVACLVMLVSGV